MDSFTYVFCAPSKFRYQFSPGACQHLNGRPLPPISLQARVFVFSFESFFFLTVSTGSLSGMGPTNDAAPSGEADRGDGAPRSFTPVGAASDVPVPSSLQVGSAIYSRRTHDLTQKKWKRIKE